MILYTMMPEEGIFPTNESEYTKQKCLNVNGVSCMVSESGTDQFEIVRLLSTNPHDFLNESYLPGKKISVVPRGTTIIES